MVNPKISIIVPVYNVEEYLKKCIESLVNQSIVEKEIIFVNDGSTDNSYSILEMYKKMYPEIIILNKENGGLSSARNAGIEIAKGDYIGFVDSDDYVDEKMFELMVNHSEEKNADMVICKHKWVFTNGEIVGSGGFKEEKILNSYQGLKEFLIKEDFGNYAWDKVYKRKLFIDNDIRYPEGKYYEDAFTTYKLIYYSETIAYLDKYLYYYYKRPGSISYSGFAQKELDYILALMEMKQFLATKNITSLNKEYNALCIKIALGRLSSLNNAYYSQTISKEDYKRFKKYLLDFLKGLDINFSVQGVGFKHKISLFLIKIDYRIFYFLDNWLYSRLQKVNR